MDVYTPKKLTQQTPILIWVHGGGYVGGDKSGMKEFATRLVSDTNVVFVSMNYETAPSAIYPIQLKQVNEVVEYLKASQEVHFNTEKIIFGGDSAGAQIALQYALVQTNKQYAHQLQFKQLLNENQIIGAISYCGPVDLEQVTHKKSDSFIMKWFVNTVAWSELGQKNWQQSHQLKAASLVNHLTNQFPPTYITDGNAYSFQEQGWLFKQRLEKLTE
ncbi:alpha/beta hydrolase [Leuconostoc palmae]|uniref:alpha/beta hydrolase n=1 Tax=Leuconostoc palmae TaxID=501487 RepID=UPI001C7DB9AB|nr:DUF1749 domain-containing protein [Leuconostoc palmae]